MKPEGIEIHFCQLHAAAPAMRDALQKLVDRYPGLEPWTPLDVKAYDQARAALALAQKEGKG